MLSFSIIASPLASATGAVDGMSLDKQVNAYTYYYAWAKCMNNTDKWDGGHTWISTDDAIEGKWFSTATGLGEEDGHVGYVASTSNGILDCNDGAIVNNALSIWGYGSDKLSILQNDFKFKKDGDGKYQPSSEYRTAFLSSIRAKAFGGKTPMMSDAAKYYFYSQSFVNGCQATMLSSPDASQKSAADSGSSNKYVRIATKVDPITKATTYAYYSLPDGKDLGSTVDAIEGTKEVGNVLGGEFDDGTVQCKTLIAKANQYALAFSVFEKDHPTLVPANSTSSTAGGKASQASTCVIDGIGWMVCPVMTFMAEIIDKSYNIVSAMLTVNAFSTTNNSLMLKAWENMRNLANVAFIIAFLVVVYSQVTGAGISNYGLKRMLPRIIVAAILVNVSFWLCALAVDVSNVIGASMRNVIEGAGGKDLGTVSINSSGATGAGWVGIVGGILSATIVTTAALYVGLAALLPALISALFVIVTVLLVLTLRQALVILLVVVSPLAFVAYLLPNTNEWFTRWRKLFIALLMMYPVIGVLFGASSLASTIVQNGAAGGTGAGAEGIKVAVQIMGALIQILPLVLLPTLMKSSAGVLGKFAGVVNNPNKGPFDRMKKGAGNLRERQEGRRTIRALNGGRTMGLGKYQRQAKKQAIDSGIKQNLSNAQNQYVASQVMNNPSLANKIAGGTSLNQADSTDIARAIQNAQFVIDKAEAEEVKAARVTFDRQGIGSNSAMDMINSGTSTGGKPLTTSERIALREKIVEAGDASHIEQLWNSSGSMEQGERNALANAIQQNKPVGVGMGAIAQMRENDASNPVGSFREVLAAGAAQGRYDPSGAAKADNSELEMLHEILSNPDTTIVDTAAAANGKATADIVAQVKADSRVARDDPRFNAGKARSSLDKLEKL